MTIRRTITALAATALVFAACGDDDDTVDQGVVDSIVDDVTQDVDDALGGDETEGAGEGDSTESSMVEGDSPGDEGAVVQVEDSSTCHPPDRDPLYTDGFSEEDVFVGVDADDGAVVILSYTGPGPDGEEITVDSTEGTVALGGAIVSVPVFQIGGTYTLTTVLVNGEVVDGVSDSFEVAAESDCSLREV